MKKLILCMMCLACTVAAQAQFERDKWFVNTSVTGLGLSYSSSEKTHFGFEVNGGAFLANNVSLLLSLGGDYGKHQTSTTAVGVGGRYYFNRSGVFLGLGLKYKHFQNTKGNDDNNNFGATVEAGYAFFLSKNVTIEPAVYYDQSFNNSDYNKIGLKVGFAYYF